MGKGTDGRRKEVPRTQPKLAHPGKRQPREGMRSPWKLVAELIFQTPVRIFPLHSVAWCPCYKPSLRPNLQPFFFTGGLLRTRTQAAGLVSAELNENTGPSISHIPFSLPTHLSISFTWKCEQLTPKHSLFLSCLSTCMFHLLIMAGMGMVSLLPLYLSKTCINLSAFANQPTLINSLMLSTVFTLTE